MIILMRIKHLALKPTKPHPGLETILLSRFKALTISRVHTGHGKPGSEILMWHFPGLESPGKRLLVLESSGNLFNTSKKYEMCGRQ